MRYINAYCEWARHPGERRTRHTSRHHTTDVKRTKSHETHHANFWNAFINPAVDKLPHNQYIEFESVSPFDSMFPRIMEIRTVKYWDVESLSIMQLKTDRRRGPSMDLDMFCAINRDRGMPQRLADSIHRLREPPNTPCYLDPFDDSFGNPPPLINPHSTKLRTRLETVYESVNPFDERFPALELVDIKPESHTSRNRRHRLSHKEKRSRLIQKKMREYARETVIRKRKLRKAFRAIPEGLRFPSPGYKTTFISVSPFDESFPNGVRAKLSTPKKLSQSRKSPMGQSLEVEEPPKLDIKRGSPATDPFPALTPIAAKAFAKRGFFGDLSPRNVFATSSEPNRNNTGFTTGLRHSLF